MRLWILVVAFAAVIFLSCDAKPTKDDLDYIMSKIPDEIDDKYIELIKRIYLALKQTSVMNGPHSCRPGYKYANGLCRPML